MKSMSIRVMVFLTIVVVSTQCVQAALVRGIDIDFVNIGNPGNPGDTRPEANPSGVGAVDYIYQIGKYEVTNAQWYDFVSAAGKPTGNPSHTYRRDADWTGDNVPTDNVGWYEAAQFCNYLTSGDKSQGAYQFSGNNTNPGDFEGIDRDSAVSTYGIVYVIPTGDEWYKAAYYTGSGYSTYANGMDTPPIRDVDSNYDQDYPYDGPWDVGSGTQEQNGTFDIMGNIWEWNETLIDGSYRGVRGGTFNRFDGLDSSSFSRYNFSASYEHYAIGFRVASVPEPTTLLLLGLGAAMVRRRR